MLTEQRAVILTLLDAANAGLTLSDMLGNAERIRFTFERDALRSALFRLADLGVVTPGRIDTSSGQPERVWRITPAGRRSVEQWRVRVRNLLRWGK